MQLRLQFAKGGEAIVQILQMLLSFRTYLATRLNNEKGATAVEYGIMVALIAAAIMVAVAAVGENLYEVFNCVADSLESFTNECS